MQAQKAPTLSLHLLLREDDLVSPKEPKNPKQDHNNHGLLPCPRLGAPTFNTKKWDLVKPYYSVADKERH